MRWLAGLGLMTLALLAGALPAHARPPGFKARLAAEGVAERVAPECFAGRGMLHCLLYGVRPPAGARCSAGGAVRSMHLPRRGGIRQRHTCVDEAFHGWPLLRSGETWRHRAFRCAHRSAGSGAGRRGLLRCRNGSGHAFAVTGHGRVRRSGGRGSDGRRRVPRRVLATRRSGVRRILGFRIGPPRTSPRAVPTLRDVVRRLGRPRSLRGRRTESCTARWGRSLELVFTTFGVRGPCAERPLQTATLTRLAWRVRIGGRRYRIGMPRRRLPRVKRYGRYGGGGYALASMPFPGGRTPTVLAHVSHGRVDRFFVFVGGGGD